MLQIKFDVENIFVAGIADSILMVAVKTFRRAPWSGLSLLPTSRSLCSVSHYHFKMQHQPQAVSRQHNSVFVLDIHRTDNWNISTLSQPVWHSFLVPTNLVYLFPNYRFEINILYTIFHIFIISSRGFQKMLVLIFNRL